MVILDMRIRKCLQDGYLSMVSGFFSRFSGVQSFGQRKTRMIALSLCCLFLPLLSVVLSPLSASAAESIISTGHAQINSYNLYTVDNGQQGCSYKSGETVSCALTINSKNVRISGIDFNLSSTVPAHSFITVTFVIQFPNSYPSQANLVGWTSQGEVSIISQEKVQDFYGDVLSITYSVRLYTAQPMQRISLRGSNGTISYTTSSTVDSTRLSLSVNSAQIQTVVGGSLEKQFMDQVLAALKTGVPVDFDKSGLASSQGQQQQIQATNNAASQAHKDSQAQVAATNSQTEQQKEQYDQEKQEESDRENSGKEDADKASGIFNFSLVNPFAPLFALFSPAETCANVPTIARWVHSETSTVCSWWSPDVRSILTPVFGISSIMLLFGFVIRWLGGSEVIDTEILK